MHDHPPTLRATARAALIVLALAAAGCSRGTGERTATATPSDTLALEPATAEQILTRVREPGARATLTLYVDKPAGITLRDCEVASRAASEVLDPLEETLPNYALEVSSPGLDRPLWSLADCERFRGRRVSVQLVRKVDGAARLKGVLEDVQGDTLTVLDEDQHRRYTARFGDVRLARLVPEL